MTKLVGDFCDYATVPGKGKDTGTCIRNVEGCLVKWRAQWTPFQEQKRVGCIEHFSDCTGRINDL